MKAARLAGAVALWGLLLAIEARAQVTGSVAVVSDYRFRGVSLSDENPALQLGVAYDHTSGLYAGVFASTVSLAEQTGRNGQLLSYVGYARRLRSGSTWEVGAAHSTFFSSSAYDYPELYCGFTSGNVSGRLYYSPDYFGQGRHGLYAELNGVRPLRERLRLVGHIGVLHVEGPGEESVSSSRNPFDIRAGIDVNLDTASVQLSWVASDGINGSYPVSDNRNLHRHAFVLSLSRSF